MPAYALADPAVAAFIVLPVVLGLVLVSGVAIAWRRGGATRDATVRATVRAAAAVAGWMAVTLALAQSGILRDWDRTPPPFFLLMAAVAALATGIATSPLGRRLASDLPLWGLVALQAFRLPLELAMHGLYTRGIMPAQMSYAGRNLDILTGTTAILVAALVATGRGGRGLVRVWNLFGLALLTNIVGVAVLSTPRFHVFGPARLNVFITYPPFVWLPAIMVLTALAGHLVIVRALHATTRPSPRNASEPSAS